MQEKSLEAIMKTQGSILNHLKKIEGSLKKRAGNESRSGYFGEGTEQ